MPNLTGNPNAPMVLSIRALETTDDALPELWNVPFQVFLNNDANLHQRVETLEVAQGGATFQTHRTAPVLDHPDGSVTTEKLADGSITAAKLAPGALSGIVPYDIALYRSGRVAGGARLLHLVAPRSITVLSNGHRVSCDTPPAAQWQAEIRRNGNAVGTISIPAGQTTGSVSLSEPVVLSEGDALTIVAQSSADANLLGIAIVLRGVA